MSQMSLFTSGENPHTTAVPGLTYIDDFITPDEEAALLKQIATLPFEPFKFRGVVANRRNFAYGFRYNFLTRTADPAPPIPAWLDPIRERVAALTGRAAGDYRQVLVIEYPEGPGIGWHKDRPEFGDVVGISLQSEAPLRFRRREGDHWKRAALPVRPRSVYVMSGEARHEWEHSITEIDYPRYSLTLRTLSDSFRPE